MFKTHRTFELTTGVKNNTIAVVAKTNLIEVLYHKTTVVVANRKKAKIGYVWEVALDNGGWDTISTRTVINNTLSQIEGWKGVFLERVKGVTVLNVNGKRQEFKPGQYVEVQS